MAGWHLIEDGFSPGDTVYQVLRATVGEEGEPVYDPYPDEPDSSVEWYSEQEWQALRECITHRLTTH